MAEPETPAGPAAADEAEGMEEVAARLGTEGGLGLIRRLTRDHPRLDLVATCVSYSARLSTPPGSAAVIDTVTGGAALADPARARYAAIGEAVERYCGNAVPAELPTGSYERLAREGRPVADPRTFALYSRAQHAQRGFPFVPMTPDLEIAWAHGEDLSDGRQILVPASLAYVNYFRGTRAAEAPTNYPILAGTAAGLTPERARFAALLEVLERDAVTVWWTSGAPAAPLVAGTGGRLGFALREAEQAGLDVTLLRIPSSFDVPVAGAFIEDRARRLVAFGSACRPTAEAAAAKALTEAVGMHATGFELLDRDGPFWRAVDAGRISRHPYRAHRADRAYLEDFRPDWRDVNDVRLHVQVYLDARMQDTRLDRLRTPAAPAASPDDAGAAGPLGSLTAHGLRAIAVDLTTPQVRAAGMHVARVMVPGLYCNAPAAFPFLGGDRLHREPAARGWVPGPLTEDDLVRDPLPFS
ncbi:hypothetical protein Ssi03_72640 [Sphaerisporangium siamense]|nr:hypothetical protein Ssi03_72640 [Sphaerisporangium siamense]